MPGGYIMSPDGSSLFLSDEPFGRKLPPEPAAQQRHGAQTRATGGGGRPVSQSVPRAVSSGAEEMLEGPNARVSAEAFRRPRRGRRSWGRFRPNGLPAPAEGEETLGNPDRFQATELVTDKQQASLPCPHPPLSSNCPALSVAVRIVEESDWLWRFRQPE